MSATPTTITQELNESKSNNPQVDSVAADPQDTRERIELRFPYEREKLALLRKHPQLANFMETHTKKMLATMNVFEELNTGLLKVDTCSPKLSLAALLIEKVGHASLPSPFDKIFSIDAAAMDIDKTDDELMKRQVEKVFEIIPIDSKALALTVSYRTAFWISEQLARFGDMSQLDQKDSDELYNIVCAISMNAICNAHKLVYPSNDLKRYQIFEDYLVAEVQNSGDFSRYLKKTAKKLLNKAHSTTIALSYDAYKDNAKEGKSVSEHEPSKPRCSIM